MSNELKGIYEEVVSKRYEEVLLLDLDADTYEVISTDDTSKEETIYPNDQSGSYMDYKNKVLRPVILNIHKDRIIGKMDKQHILEELDKDGIYAVLMNVITNNEVRFKQFDFVYVDKEKHTVLLLVEDYTEPQQTALITTLKLLNGNTVLFKEMEHREHLVPIFASEGMAKMMSSDMTRLFEIEADPHLSIHSDDYNRVISQLETISLDNPHLSFKYHKKNADGKWLYVAADYSYIQVGTQRYLYATFNDITDLENALSVADAANKKLHAHDWKDELTGFLSITSFMQKMTEATKNYETQKEKKLIDVIKFDIVNFKLYNKEKGMAEGDKILVKVASILKDIFTDFELCRNSADHFYVLSYHETTRNKIIEAHERIRLETPQNVEVRAGIYTLTSATERATLACDRAKLACDHASGDMRTYYRFYNNSMEEELVFKNYIVSHLDEAIEKKWIKTWYQMVKHTLSGKICGLEALARWDDPNYGFLSPGQFIAVLEENHLITKLDLLMVRNVCQDMRKRLDEGKEVVPVSINLSKDDFDEVNIHKIINDILDEYGIEHHMIHIEVTESILENSEDFIRNHIDEFHKDGYEVWMDDFGSGYSSLSTLHTYDFDVLKLDMAFMRMQNEKTASIVSSIINMAKQLGISTLAEGVETREQLEFLRKIGCERIQGYYLNQPQPLLGTLSTMSSKGFELSSADDIHFYNQVGKINVLSSRPTVLDTYRYQASSTPIAIVELEDEVHKTIYANKAYEENLALFGIKSIEHVDALNNDQSLPYYKLIRESLERANQEGVVSDYDFVDGDLSGRLRYQLIAGNDKKKAYLATAVNLYGSNELSESKKNKDVLQNFYALFDSVKIIDRDNRSVEHIFGSITDLEKEEYSQLDNYTSYLLNHLIVDDDKERFKAYIENDDFLNKVEFQPHHILEDFYRMHDADGDEWKHILISEIPNTRNEHRFLMCVKKLGNMIDPNELGTTQFVD